MFLIWLYKMLLEGGDVMRTYVGIDGCPFGWAATVFHMDNSTGQVFLYKHIAELWEAHRDAELILIDMPIGLPDTRHMRHCESEARALLKPYRASSIFPVPVREVLEAANYEQAGEWQRRLSGKGLSKQTWNIVPKIRELDRLVRSEPLAKLRFQESHPELAFAAWSGAPMRNNKKTESGYKERMEILSKLYAPSEQIVVDTLARTPRSQVARDDLVDSLALAVSALHGSDGLAYVPNVTPPPEDGEGLVMRIAYPMRRMIY